MEDIILYFVCKYHGDWERVYDALEKQEDVDFYEINLLKQKYENNYLTIISDKYPAELKTIERPPFILFFKGNLELFDNKNKIWYYGSYYDEKFSKEAAKHKTDADKENITIVSGYSNDFEKKYVNNIFLKDMIIVKDSGINSYINMTKVEEKLFLQNNLIISEYPDKVIPTMNTWEESNRIKHGLCKGIFLLNTIKEKVTFNLISNVIDESRDVYCYNKKIDEKSHNLTLINKGAYAINNLKEMKE